jgi:hypothetical protein
MIQNSKIGAFEIRAKKNPHSVKLFCLEVLKPSGQAVANRRRFESISLTLINIREAKAPAEAMKRSG